MRAFAKAYPDEAFVQEALAQIPEAVPSPDPVNKKRRDTSLESVGAEHLVLAHLLLEGIPAYKAYDRTGGYDLVAVNPPKNLSVRIQVKSRWATDYDKGFPFGDSYGSDFAVLAELNRGYSWRSRGGKKDPVLYVVPTTLCRAHRRRSSDWGKVFLQDIPKIQDYRFNWGLIKRALCLTRR